MQKINEKPKIQLKLNNISILEENGLLQDHTYDRIPLIIRKSKFLVVNRSLG